MKALHSVSLYFSEKRALNRPLWNSFFQSEFHDLITALRPALGPQLLCMEHKTKRPGREGTITFNRMSPGGWGRGTGTSENVLFPIIMEYTLPLKICFPERQRSFSLREQRVA